jgi:hypothetical protein
VTRPEGIARARRHGVASSPATSDLPDPFAVALVSAAVAATLVFGRILTDDLAWAAALYGGLDWTLLHLLRTAVVVARRRRLALWAAALALSIVATGLWAPDLLGWRALFAALGVAVAASAGPVGQGQRHLWAPVVAALLLVVSSFVYPIAAAGYVLAHPGGWDAVAVLVGFFVLVALICVIVGYAEPQAKSGPPPFVAAHGPEATRSILDGLVLLSLCAVVLGVATSALGLREALLAAGPVALFALYRGRIATWTARDSTAMARAAFALCVGFLLGTWLWELLELPDNLFVGGLL